MYEFDFTPNVTGSSGDYIGIEFTTADGFHDPLFSNDLGKSVE
jgi:hypothetical protein